MPAHPLMNYDLWTTALDQNALMASAAELHGLVAGMLSAGVPADASQILPVLHDFLNDGQAVNAALKSQISELISETARQLAPLGLAYVHVIEGQTGGPRDFQQGDAPFDYAALRAAYRDAGGQGAWMVNNGYDLALAQQALDGGADLVAFGKGFIANPDLTRRLRQGGPFNEPDRATFYGGGTQSEKGYTDYPALA